MIAWRRHGIGRLLMLAGVPAVGLVLAGCEWARQPEPKTGGRGAPVSRLPEQGKAGGQASAAEPEILPETHLSAGKMHELHGRLVRAAEQYRLAIGAKPDYVEAYNRLGIVLDQLRQFPEADQAFSRAIVLAPGQAHLHNNLAFSLVMQQRWQDAEVELARALELHPEFTRARVNLAMVFAQQERFEEAMTQFQMAVPRADAYFNMGLMYQSRGRPAAAAVAFKTALALNPDMIAARKRLDLLPAELVSAAEVDSAALASPRADVAVVTRREPEMGQRPSTQPADTTEDGEMEADESDPSPEWTATTRPAEGGGKALGCGDENPAGAGPTMSQGNDTPARGNRPSTQPARSDSPEALADPPAIPRRLGLEIETTLDQFDWDARESLSFLFDLAAAMDDLPGGPCLLDGTAEAGSPPAPEPWDLADPADRTASPSDSSVAENPQSN